MRCPRPAEDALIGERYVEIHHECERSPDIVGIVSRDDVRNGREPVPPFTHQPLAGSGEQNESRQKAASESLSLAGPTGLDPATSGVTGPRSNRLNYDPARVKSVQPSSRSSVSTPFRERAAGRETTTAPNGRARHARAARRVRGPNGPRRSEVCAGAGNRMDRHAHAGRPRALANDHAAGVRRIDRENRGTDEKTDHECVFHRSLRLLG